MSGRRAAPTRGAHRPFAYAHIIARFLLRQSLPRDAGAAQGDLAEIGVVAEDWVFLASAFRCH